MKATKKTPALVRVVRELLKRRFSWADTGEIVEEQQAEADTAAEGFSAADAFELGREARKAGKALRAVPPEWRDNPAFEAFASAWQDGWREADGEAAK